MKGVANKVNIDLLSEELQKEIKDKSRANFICCVAAYALQDRLEVLPVWSLKTEHTMHHLIGTIHFVSPKFTLKGQKKLMQAIEQASVFMMENDSAKILGSMKRKASSMKMVSPDYLIFEYARGRKKRVEGLDPKDGSHIKKLDMYRASLNPEKDPIKRRVQTYLALLSSHQGIKEWAQGRSNDGKEIEKLVFTSREKYWLETKKLLETLKESKQSHCVCVGTGHWVGEDGLIARFKKAGLKVERLNP